MKVKTYIKELAAVTVVLSIVWAASGCKPIAALGTLAVILTFCYVQVATRMDEKTQKETGRVSCQKLLAPYLVAKETCWLIYFWYLGSYSALVGVSIFLAYPWYRHWRRR